MIPLNKLMYKAQKESVALLVNRIMAEKNPENRKKTLKRLTTIMETFFGDLFEEESFANARKLIDEGGKWFQFLNTALDTLNPHVVKTAVMDLGFESGFYGLRTRDEAKAKYHCNIPWAILFDPTSASNLHCIGCWAAEYGHTLNLSFDVMDKIVSQGKEVGCHFYLLTGGEPLVRKADILKLCRKHPDCEFHAFTNGTLIDDAFCQEVVKVGNLSFSLSVEGFREVNDSRRGEGVFDKVMHAMDLMKENGLLFGTSICYTSANIEAVTNDDFMRFLCDKGAHFGFYFHYMPVGNDAAPELMPTPEQRKYMIDRIRYLRSSACDIPFYPMDFQNDGEFVGGCIAGGRNYFHINSAGDAEPCVFIHYSNANIHDSSILEILQSPLFMAYHNGQPFNKNHLRPCPMLENPELLEKMVHETGAHSTDLQSPETVDHLCDKCKAYADNWQPVADEIWSHTKIRESRYENYKDWKPNQQ